jgi:hypothetical protein
LPLTSRKHRFTTSQTANRMHLQAVRRTRNRESLLRRDRLAGAAQVLDRVYEEMAVRLSAPSTSDAWPQLTDCETHTRNPQASTAR